jgi:hypothetical protein
VPISLCCCVSRGFMTLSVTGARDTFMPGEPLTFSLGATNESTKDDCERIKCTLMRELTLTSFSGGCSC